MEVPGHSLSPSKSTSNTAMFLNENFQESNCLNIPMYIVPFWFPSQISLPYKHTIANPKTNCTRGFKWRFKTFHVNPGQKSTQPKQKPWTISSWGCWAVVICQSVVARLSRQSFLEVSKVELHPTWRAGNGLTFRSLIYYLFRYAIDGTILSQ